jgi:hypothetical protein
VLPPLLDPVAADMPPLSPLAATPLLPPVALPLRG